MKYKIILMFITLSVLLNSCVTNEYETPDSISDIAFYTSEGTARQLNVGLLNYMTFTDLSQGAIQHAWSIENGDAFLKGPIARTQTGLDSNIIYPGDTVTSDKTVIVYFKEPGDRKVRLYNTFNDSVTFRGFNGEYYNMASTKVGNKWVIDTTFMVKVFDTIVPNIEVKQLKEGVEVSLDHTSKDTIYVEAGDFLHVIDNTTQGEPTARNWFVRTKKDPTDNTSVSVQVAGSQGQDAQLLLKKLGVYEGGINISRSGELIPSDSENYIFKSPIKVIPSSKPFGLSGTIKELKDETLRLSFNGEFVSFNNKEEFFEVKVNGAIFNIESVEVDKTDATFVNIKLVDPIYQDDVITVSWFENSGIKSTDSREPIVFTDAAVKSYIEEHLISEGQFENALDLDWIKVSPNAAIDGITEVLIVDAPVGVPTSVSPSGKVINVVINRGNTGSTANNARADTKNTEVNLTTGQEYVIKFKYFVRAGSTNVLFRFNNAGGANQLVFNPGSGNADNVDKWKEAEIKFTANAAQKGKFGILCAWNKYADFYIDDLTIKSFEERPTN